MKDINSINIKKSLIKDIKEIIKIAIKEAKTGKYKTVIIDDIIQEHIFNKKYKDIKKCFKFLREDKKNMVNVIYYMLKEYGKDIEEELKTGKQGWLIRTYIYHIITDEMEKLEKIGVDIRKEYTAGQLEYYTKKRRLSKKPKRHKNRTTIIFKYNNCK